MYGSFSRSAWERVSGWSSKMASFSKKGVRISSPIKWKVGRRWRKWQSGANTSLKFPILPCVILTWVVSIWKRNRFAAAVNEAADAYLSVHYPDCNGILIINALLYITIPLWPNTIYPFCFAWFFLQVGIIKYSPLALLLSPLPMDEKSSKASFCIPAQTALWRNSIFLTCCSLYNK